MPYWDNDKEKWVEKYKNTADLKQRADTDSSNGNKVKLIGKLLQFIKYSDRVGQIKVQVFGTHNGKHTESHFYCTLFPPAIEDMEEVELGSRLKIRGYLKNVGRESGGKTVTSLEIIVDTIEIEE